MRAPAQPHDEVQRLKALRQFHLLDTPPEQVLDELAKLAANICGTPISLISLIDEDRQWFKSRVGLEVSESPRGLSFCGHTILQRDLLVVPDAKRDERFANNPHVIGDPHIEFYAGAPLITPEGYALGTLCVIDRIPRTLTPMQQEALRVLSGQVMAQLEFRRQAHELAGTSQTLTAVTEALAAYAERGDWKEAMGRLLRCALDQTQSEYGFIGVVVGSTLRVLAHEGIVWDKIANRDFYEEALKTYEARGYLEFTSFNNLFGRAITTGQVVIANTPDSDPRSGGRPTGHPPMRSFLGVPIFVGEQVQGLVALANRPGGYSEAEQHRIETLVQHAGGLCTSYRQRETATELEQERAKAKAALAQAEGNRRAVWRTSIDAIITMDESGHITDFNPAAEKIFGYRAADVIGQPLADKIIPPALREGHRRGMAKFLATGQGPIMGRRIELSALRSDGTEFPVELAVVSVTGAERPTFLGTVRDITERKRAEEALRASEANMAAAQHISHFGSWELELAHRENTSDLPLRWSDEMFRIAGYEPGEVPITRELFYQRVHPEDREMLRQAVAKAIHERGTYAVVHRLIQPSGEERLLQQSAQIFYDEKSGRPLRIVGTTHDITEQRKAETERDRLFNLSLDMLCVASFEGMIVQVNPAWTKHLGWTAEELTSRPSLDFVHPEDREATQRTREQIIQGQPIRDFDNRYRCKDGSWRWLSWNVHPFVESRQVFGVARDITEQRQLAEQLEAERSRLLAAQSVAKIGSWETDLTTLSVNWSAETHRIFETDPATFHPTHQRFLDLVHPEDRALVDEAFVHSLSQGASSALEHRLRLPEGRVKFVEERWQVFQDQEGKPVRALGTCQDISERKTAEDKVRASETNMAEAQRIGHFGSWELKLIAPDNLHANPLRWSDEVYRIFGIEPSAFGATYEAFFAAVHPDDRERMDTAQRRALSGEENLNLEHRIVRPDGTIRWLRELGELKRDDSGRVTHLTGTVLDITERKEAEAEVRVSESKFRQLADSNVLGIISWDAQGNISDANDAFLHMFGYTREELRSGQIDWRNMTPPELRAADEKALQEIAATGSCTPFEKEYFHKDGRRVAILVGAAALDGAKDRGLCYVVDISQQKQAVAALRVSEERFRTVAKATNDAIWDWNLTTHQLWWNEGYEKLFGYSRAEADPTVKSRTDHIHPEDLSRVTDGIHHVIEHGGEDWSDEYRFRCQDGRYSHVLDRGQVIRDAAGKPVRMIGGMTDLTKLKEHEIALSQSNRALQLLSRCNEALIRSESESGLLATICQIAVDVGGCRLAWVGYARDDAAKTIEILSHAGVEEGYLAQLRVTWDENQPVGRGPAGQVIRHGEPVVIPDLEADESFRPWLEAARARGFRGVIALPLTDQQRTFGLLVLYLPEARQPLPDELHLLRELADDMAFGIVNIRTRLDRRRLHTAVEQVATAVSAATNNDFFEQLARSMAAAVGAQAGFVAQMLPGEPLTARTIAAVVDNAVAANFDYVLKGTPCEKFSASDSCVVHEQVAQQFPQSPSLAALGAQAYVGRRLDSSAGKLLGLLFVLFRRPITEAEAGFVMSTLQIFSARAAAELERQQLETQLRQSQKMEAIGQLAGGIAHDFNNILAVMMMQAELTGMVENLPDEVQEGLREIRAAAERAASLTRQLLLFSRKQVMQSRQLDLNEVVTSLAKMLQRIIGEDVRLQLNLHPRPLLTHADAGMLDQVLMNLVVNARDAMPGGGQLFIETSANVFTAAEAAAIPDASPGRYVGLRVTDTGSGMPPEILAHIFEPFFTTKEPGKGTGLGLATVFGIVKQHNGALTVGSEVGKGTTFRLFLRAEEATAKSRAEAAVKPRPRGGTETILIVEDEPAVRMLTRVVLERAGYQVLEAAHGVEALEIWDTASEKIHLLLTDIVMPEGLSGRELAARLREKRPGLRVIFTSGYSADIAGRELALQEGQNFIQKPSSPQQLLETVRHSLDT